MRSVPVISNSPVSLVHGNGWPLRKFGEVLQSNKRPYTLGPDEDADLVGMRLYGHGPFHRERKLASKIMKKSHFVVKSGDVIYNKLFAWKGTFGIVPEEFDDMFVSDKFPTYTHDPGQLDLGYLRWFFRCPTLWEQARQMSTGSAALSKLTLNPPRFLDLLIPLPPLEEQRRIVNRIEFFYTRIDVACSLRRATEGRPEALFLSEIDNSLSGLRKLHREKSLIQLVDPERGISYGVVQTGTPYEGGIPTLRAGDIRRFTVLTDAVKHIDPEIERRYGRTRLEGNEVLLRIRGGFGEAAVCPDSMIGGNVSREIAVIPLVGDVCPRFVMFAIAAPSNQEFLRRHLRGTSYVGLNLKDVRRLAIPIPPMREQRRIVAYLDGLQAKVDCLKSLQEMTAAKLDALLPAILDKAFKGEL